MALVLMRRDGEKILIGDDIEIMVNQISGKQVHLSIIAPRSLYVRREELDRKPKPNKKAP